MTYRRRHAYATTGNRVKKCVLASWNRFCCSAAIAIALPLVGPLARLLRAHAGARWLKAVLPWLDMQTARFHCCAIVRNQHTHRQLCLLCRVKTPGGKLVFQTATKIASVAKCGDCGAKLSGVRAPECAATCMLMSLALAGRCRSPEGSAHAEAARAPRHPRLWWLALRWLRPQPVRRWRCWIWVAHLDLLCSIVRAFLIEEQKIVKSVLRSRKAAAKGAPCCVAASRAAAC